MEPPPKLLEDVIGEILLRLPPDEPAYIVRASLVCKGWHYIISNHTFLRRYRRFHRTPLLLGFFDLCSPVASFPSQKPSPSPRRKLQPLVHPRLSP
jgi:hypothetical protein